MTSTTATEAFFPPIQAIRNSGETTAVAKQAEGYIHSSLKLVYERVCFFLNISSLLSWNGRLLHCLVVSLLLLKCELQTVQRAA